VHPDDDDRRWYALLAAFGIARVLIAMIYLPYWY
jgi:hypothetical protein